MGFVRRKLATTQKENDNINFFLGLSLKNEFSRFKIKTEDWFEVKDFVLSEWITNQPGTRPQGWWRYEAPECKRAQLSGGGKLYPAFDNERNFRSCLGIPEVYWFMEKPTSPPTYESEATYLKRLGLFFGGEKARLTKADFEPEVISLEQIDSDFLFKRSRAKET